jgi:hypothetical protein
MKLSKYDHEVLSQLDELLLSENESVRELLQQAMVMQALSKDTDESKQRDKILGPFQKMMHAVQYAEDRIQSLELQLAQMKAQDRDNITTGGYWTNTTNTSGAVAYPAVGSIWQTAAGPAVYTGNTTSMLDQEYLNKLGSWVKDVPKLDKTIAATTADDPDAMVLTDPDTGHKMYVK